MHEKVEETLSHTALGRLYQIKKMKVINTFQVEKYAARVQVKVVRWKEEEKKVERKFGSKE